jgi:adenylate cyclase
VEIGIGAHYGEAVVGSIGDGQRLDYLVIGDTVNVTSRLERLTRELDAQIVVTDELVTRVRVEGAAADGLLDRFKRHGEVRVAGRDQPVTVWTVAREPTRYALPP